MNDQPHSHKLTVDSYGRLQYGDQADYIALMSNYDHFRAWHWPDWYLRWKVRRKITKLIRKHDRASRRPDRHTRARDIVAQVMAEMQPEEHGWGSLSIFKPDRAAHKAG